MSKQAWAIAMMLAIGCGDDDAGSADAGTDAGPTDAGRDAGGEPDAGIPDAGPTVWDTCPDEPRATAESLADKAAYYDAIAARLHIHPELRWLAPVRLAAGADEATATWMDVERWSTGENDGLWSSLFLASQAYRYAVTRDAAALDVIRTLI